MLLFPDSTNNVGAAPATDGDAMLGEIVEMLPVECLYRVLHIRVFTLLSHDLCQVTLVT